MPENSLKRNDELSKQVLARVRDACALVDQALLEVRLQRRPYRGPAPKPAAGLSAEELVHTAIALHGADRAVAAGAALVTAQQLDPKQLETAELLLGKEQVAKLIGALLYRGAVLRCTQCGAETICRCGCGQVYRLEPIAHPPTTPLARAKAAIAARPKNSNRRIAREIGVSIDTVNRARRSFNHRSP